MVPQRRRRRRIIQKVGLGAYKLVVSRGLDGFGFTISGEAPCVVSHVSQGSPAERAGLRVGLVLLAVGSSPVTKVAHDVVARLIASAPQAIALTVTTDRGRDASDTSEDESMSQRPRHPQRVRCRPTRPEVRNKVDQMYKKKLQSTDPHAPLLVSAALKEPCKSHLAHTNPDYSLQFAACNPASEVLSPSVLYNLRHQQQIARSEKKLECRAIVGYLGTIETPAQMTIGSEHSTVRASIRKLRHAKRSATLVLMTILPLSMNIKISNGTIISEHTRERIVYVSRNSENDYRYFGLITCRSHVNDICLKTCGQPEISHNCHVFSIDPKLIEHNIHIITANEFQIKCTLDPVTNHCLEFPTSCEYVVNVIRSMYSLHIPNGLSSPGVENLSKLAIKSASPSAGSNLSKNNNRLAPLRGFKYGKKINGCRHDMKRIEFSLNKLDIHNFANSPQPSNHSEFTTTSSNSDSGIGFHNDCQNIRERLLADFGHQARHLINFPNKYESHVTKKEPKPRPLGITDSNFEMDSSFLSNTMPVVDGFGGRGQPLNPLDDVILSACDGQSSFHSSPGKSSDSKVKSDDTYNYNGIHYGNILAPSLNKMITNDCKHHYENVKDICPHYDPVYTENEGNHYEMIKPQLGLDLDSINIKLKATHIYHEGSAIGIENTEKPTNFVPDYSLKSSNDTESVENVTVISSKSQDYINSGKTSIDSMSIYSSKSQDYYNASTIQLKNLKGSVDDILMFGLGECQQKSNDDYNFLHPANVKIKARKKHLNLLSKTKTIFHGKDNKKSGKSAEKHARVLSASVDDICGSQASMENSDMLPTACSEPDLRDSCSHNSESEQTSPFRRWTTSTGPGSSYRHPDQKMYNKQESNGVCTKENSSKGGGVARWSLGLEHLLADKAGADAFAAFLAKEFAAENIKFWWSCEQYKSVPESSRASVAREIWSRHLAEGAPEPVNVDAPARKTAGLNLEQPTPELFHHAQKQIFNLMKFDSYPRFLRSPEHAECARADLRGDHTHTYNNLLTATPPTPTKLKKSASNVSERRRSGGSLLPWSRLRAISKDREQTSIDDKASSSSTEIAPTSISCSLCRVLLPDGATSVVGVEASQSVQSVLDRLLAKRALPVRTYDVTILTDTQPTPVDLHAPSSVLGGNLARIERRCVFRLELPSRRCVAVRCRPGKRLRHVLRPVLQRYLPDVGVTVRTQGEIVAADTRAVDIDGYRLQVTVDECAPKEDPQDDDTQDDLRLCDETGLDQRSISSEGSRSGVVRAALRPGPPLHTHPPEFLENLRQTQRARLQQKSPPDATPSKALPPPLPPKPRHIPTNMAGALV